jgi:ABC-type hemin transport system substrate-binding protein
MRIVSLVPSWTEYIVDLGLENALVGRTKFCVRPQTIQRIQVVGGTKHFHVDRVEALKPDFVIACKEENTREQVEHCATFSQVLLTDVRSVEGAFMAMMHLAEQLDESESGERWCERIRLAWGNPVSKRARAAYIIWKNPLMVAGRDTFIHDVMRWWGIVNACADVGGGRYPTLEKVEFDSLKLDHVLLSSEPFPFNATHEAEFTTNGRLAKCVDGEAFSWYGSRMYHAASYLKTLSHLLLETTN